MAFLVPGSVHGLIACGTGDGCTLGVQVGFADDVARRIVVPFDLVIGIFRIAEERLVIYTEIGCPEEVLICIIAAQGYGALDESALPSGRKGDVW